MTKSNIIKQIGSFLRSASTPAAKAGNVKSFSYIRGLHISRYADTSRELVLELHQSAVSKTIVRIKKDLYICIMIKKKIGDIQKIRAKYAVKIKALAK
jgi:hypothetical protein